MMLALLPTRKLEVLTSMFDVFDRPVRCYRPYLRTSSTLLSAVLADIQYVVVGRIGGPPVRCCRPYRWTSNTLLPADKLCYDCLCCAKFSMADGKVPRRLYTLCGHY